MFNDKKQSISPPAPLKAEEKIYTMPMEYYLGAKTVEATRLVQMPAAVGSSAMPEKKKTWRIVIAVLLVLVVAGSAWLLVKSYEKPVVPAAPTLTTEQPAVPAEKAAPAPVVPEIKTEETAKPVFNPAQLNKFSLSLLASADQDKDGLTDAEESLIGTDITLKDTDGDSYLDGEEIANFYSPLDKDLIRLDTKDFVKEYSNSIYGYKLLYPSSWLIKALNGQDPQDVMVTSTENEFINILIDQKKSEQTIDDWYLEKALTVKPADLKHYQTFNKLSVLESPDAFTVYLAKENTVYIINYNIGLKEEASFPAMFQMVVNSFGY